MEVRDNPVRVYVPVRRRRDIYDLLPVIRIVGLLLVAALSILGPMAALFLLRMTQ